MSRAHDNGPFKEFDVADWFCDSLYKFREEMEHNKAYVRKQSFRTHMRNAVKEQLLAVRDVIDAAVEQLDKQETGHKTRQA